MQFIVLEPGSGVSASDREPPKIFGTKKVRRLSSDHNGSLRYPGPTRYKGQNGLAFCEPTVKRTAGRASPEVAGRPGFVAASFQAAMEVSIVTAGKSKQSAPGRLVLAWNLNRGEAMGTAPRNLVSLNANATAPTYPRD